MTVDADTKAFLARLPAAVRFPAGNVSDSSVMAAYIANKRSAPRRERKIEPVADVDDVAINSQLSARLYRPAINRILPVVLYFHGGGWVFGNLESDDFVCRRIANQADCAVISVDYRLAPEFTFPAAHDDAKTALEWVSNNASTYGMDINRLAVMGSSAGGNLAASLSVSKANSFRDPASGIALQVLFYPVLDSAARGPSYEEYREGPLLSAEEMQWFWSQYVPDQADRKDHRVSPAHCQDLRDQPPTIVITAECDPVRSDGLDYADRLRRSGVPVVAVSYPGQIHGFVSFSDVLPAGSRVLADVCHRVRTFFQDGDLEYLTNLGRSTLPHELKLSDELTVTGHASTDTRDSDEEKLNA